VVRRVTLSALLRETVGQMDQPKSFSHSLSVCIRAHDRTPLLVGFSAMTFGIYFRIAVSDSPYSHAHGTVFWLRCCDVDANAALCELPDLRGICGSSRPNLSSAQGHPALEPRAYRGRRRHGRAPFVNARPAPFLLRRAV
jgi:hypothetical protein